MRFTLKNPRSLQYIDYQNVRKTEFLGCQSQDAKYCDDPIEEYRSDFLSAMARFLKEL